MLSRLTSHHSYRTTKSHNIQTPTIQPTVIPTSKPTLMPTPMSTLMSTTQLDETIDLSIVTVNYNLLNVRAGQQIRYTLYYQNTGDRTATEVIIHQSVPHFTTYDPVATNELPTAPPWQYTDTAAGSILTAEIGVLYPHERGRLEVIFVMDEILPVRAPEITSEAIIQSLSFEYPDENLFNNIDEQVMPMGWSTVSGMLWADEDGDGRQGLNENERLANVPLDVLSVHIDPTLVNGSVRITTTENGVFTLSEVLYGDFFVNCLDPRCPYTSLAVKLDEASGLAMPLKTAHDVQVFKEQLDTNNKSQSDLWFVHFVPHTSDQERHKILSSMGQLVDWWPQIDVALVEPNPAIFDPQLLLQHKTVTYVEPDREITGLGMALQTQPQQFGSPLDNRQIPPVEGSARFTPNDPDLADTNLTYAANIIQAFEAWNITTGSEEVIIAIVDTGIVTEHLDIDTSRVLTGYDFVHDDNFPDDENGHGTHITGIIAATINNGVGASGICPKCKLLPVKVLDKQNTGRWSAISEGILYAADQGAHIMNLSLGGQFPPRVLEQAVKYAMNNNVLMVGAGGNTGTETILFPAGYEEVIGVGATNDQDQRWDLSSTGPHIELSAPGQSIYSTWGNSKSRSENFVFLSGTSMASPHVAAIAGLLLSQDSTLTPETIRQMLIDSSLDLGVVDLDDEYGHGRVNALHALRLLDKKVYLPTIYR
ncbi:MAG: S8 family peptidase [Chloroflexota bacterium]